VGFRGGGGRLRGSELHERLPVILHRLPNDDCGQDSADEEAQAPQGGIAGALPGSKIVELETLEFLFLFRLHRCITYSS
jgi:hypothetical protein